MDHLRRRDSVDRLTSSVQSPGTLPEEDWCVHAQLTITQPTTGISFSSSSTQNIPKSSENPNLSVHYSWQNSRVESVTTMVPIVGGIKKFESWSPSLATPPGEGRGLVDVQIPPDSGYSSDRVGKTGRLRTSLATAPAAVRWDEDSSAQGVCKTTRSITLKRNSNGRRSGSAEPVSEGSLVKTVLPPVVLQDAETQTQTGGIGQNLGLVLTDSGFREKRLIGKSGENVKEKRESHYRKEYKSEGSGSGCDRRMEVASHKIKPNGKDGRRAKSSPPIRSGQKLVNSIFFCVENCISLDSLIYLSKLILFL